MGYGTFAAIYLLSGLGGSIASFLFSDLVTVGASGAIFGLLGMLQLTILHTQHWPKHDPFHPAAINCTSSAAAGRISLIADALAASGRLYGCCTR